MSKAKHRPRAQTRHDWRPYKWKSFFFGRDQDGYECRKCGELKKVTEVLSRTGCPGEN